ncbi:hypothetical protein L1987_56586 [Smallanthus sonchifolius]|uniref:Uncharacterized protein n=1 Tax=Smallanthus sonchifolius TaxID=185202 RepID=A0ACB9EDW8_9ASTR|nr:hypothetical protein L1987_56586 [Smallanthus sonchifolius]
MEDQNYFVNLMDFINKPAVVETFVDIFLCAVPIWVAVMLGVLIGWAWTPRWTSLVFIGFRSKLRGFAWTAPPGFGARRLWLAFTALSAFSVARRMWSNFREKERKDDQSSPRAVAAGESVADQYVDGSILDIKCSIVNSGGIHDVVTENDLEYLLHLLNGKDAVWQSMIERSTSNMACQAWRYEPESGPVVYRSRTVFEDATPELVRDFFWDDEFRPKWDPMLTYVKILEECRHTGTMIVNWIKKFPFFCSDREYVIGRRIWEAGKTYYCVTKGVQYPGLRRRDKPRRVDSYFSSWVIRPVQSRKGDGVLSSCEVILLHSEDMGIPRDVAKLGVRHGMWGTVKKLHGGFRAYQSARKQDMTLSRCALMAAIATKISFDETVPGDEKKEDVTTRVSNAGGGVDWRWVAVGGAVAVVFGLRTGTLGKVLLVGAGQRFGRRR